MEITIECTLPMPYRQNAEGHLVPTHPEGWTPSVEKVVRRVRRAVERHDAAEWRKIIAGAAARGHVVPILSGTSMQRARSRASEEWQAATRTQIRCVRLLRGYLPAIPRDCRLNIGEGYIAYESPAAYALPTENES
jgi:hypothetical protein